MARSIATPSTAVMDSLRNVYEFRDEAEVAAFLADHPTVPSLLAEIRPAIRRFFGEEPVRLEVSEDPDCDVPPTLLVNIQTQYGAAEAISRLARFDHEAGIEMLHNRDTPVLVSIIAARRV
jgi:hypothetical protein